MGFSIIQGDITRMQTDAIVNAANSALRAGGGVCGAIFRAAGVEQLTEACRALGGCETGRSKVTPGFALPARWVIHAVGPVWQGGGHNEAALLRSCYESALEIARQKQCRSVAFPLISGGIYGYPQQQAMEIACSALEQGARDTGMQLYLAVLDEGMLALGRACQTAGEQS